jgi:hypothetical protein
MLQKQQTVVLNAVVAYAPYGVKKGFSFKNQETQSHKNLVILYILGLHKRCAEVSDVLV